MPMALMTGFGYDPGHSIVKARQAGLQAVLYKPFRLDQLLETVEQLVTGAAPSSPPIARIVLVLATGSVHRPTARGRFASIVETDVGRWRYSYWRWAQLATWCCGSL